MPDASPLLQLIQRASPSSEPRTPTRVCCGPSSACDGSGNAWLFAGRAVPASVSGLANKLSRDTTIFVSSSARPRDDGDANLRMLIDSLQSVRREVRLAGAAAVLIFDGLGGKPSVSAGMTRRYASKIARALVALPDVSVLVSDEWLHQANSLRCAMTRAAPRRTPLVFVIQDDTQVGPGGIETHALHRMLLHDPSVEYVRLAIYGDCADPRGRLHQGYTPCDGGSTPRK